MANNNILILDNKKGELEELKNFLLSNGFKVKSLKKSDLLLNELEAQIPDLLILPVETDSLNGIDLCAKVKSKENSKNTFVILISKKKEEFSLIAALDSGADDYLLQPLHFRVLLSRINALLKRKNLNLNQLITDELIIDEERYLIIKKGEEFYLPKKEFEILSLLKSKPNKVFSRDEIKNSIWTNFEKVRGRTVDVHIRKIREKIGEDLISTVKGVGYRLELD